MAKTKPIGPTQIRMFEEMLKEQFQPLLVEVEIIEESLKRRIEIDVRKEVGIYKLSVEAAALKRRLAEVEEVLKAWEKADYRHESKLAKAVESRMNSEFTLSGQIRGFMKGLRDDLRLAVLPTEVQDIFRTKIPTALATFTAQVQQIKASERPLLPEEQMLLGTSEEE